MIKTLAHPDPEAPRAVPEPTVNQEQTAAKDLRAALVSGAAIRRQHRPVALNAPRATKANPVTLVELAVPDPKVPTANPEKPATMVTLAPLDPRDQPAMVVDLVKLVERDRMVATPKMETKVRTDLPAMLETLAQPALLARRGTMVVPAQLAVPVHSDPRVILATTEHPEDLVRKEDQEDLDKTPNIASARENRNRLKLNIWFLFIFSISPLS